MTDTALRNIFSRFQNLNLVVLIARLERRNVAVGNWIIGDNGAMFGSRKILCPLAHGLSVETDARYSLVNEEEMARRYSLSLVQIAHFTNWWDRQCTCGHCGDEARYRLLEVLRSIFAERLNDADAVQGVINQLAPPLCRKAQDVSVSETVG